MNPSIHTTVAPQRSGAPRPGGDTGTPVAGSATASPGDFSAALRAVLPAPTPDGTQPREAKPPRQGGAEERSSRPTEAPPTAQASRPRRATGASTTPPGGAQAQAELPDAVPPAPLPMPGALLPPDAHTLAPEAPIAIAPEWPAWLPQPEPPVSPIAPQTSLEPEFSAERPGNEEERDKPWNTLPPEALPPERSPLPLPESPKAVAVLPQPAGVLADARAAAERVAKPVMDPGARTGDPSPAPAASSAPATATTELIAPAPWASEKLAPGLPSAPSAPVTALPMVEAREVAAVERVSAAAGTWTPMSGTVNLSEARPQRAALPVERLNPEAPRAESILPEQSARADWLQAAQPMLPSAPPSLALPASPPLAVNQPAFADELGTQVAMWTRQGVQQAELRLNPAELGPVQVRIQLQGDQAQVQFVAEAAVTRDALQAALPELSKALAAEGLQLAGADVQAGRQDGREARNAGDAEARRGLGSGLGRRAGSERGEPEEARGAWAPPIRASRGLLDLYA